MPQRRVVWHLRKQRPSSFLSCLDTFSRNPVPSDSFMFFWYKWCHSHYPQSRPRVSSRLALSVLSTTQWDSRKVTWWRWMWTSWNNCAENAKTQRVCIAWSYGQRKEQKSSKCQLRTGLSVPLKCSLLHESAATSSSTAPMDCAVLEKNPCGFMTCKCKTTPRFFKQAEVFGLILHLVHFEGHVWGCWLHAPLQRGADWKCAFLWQRSSAQICKLGVPEGEDLVKTWYQKTQGVDFGCSQCTKKRTFADTFYCEVCCLAWSRICSMHHAFVVAEVGAVNFFGRLGPVIEELRWEAQRALSALDQKAGQ